MVEPRHLPSPCLVVLVGAAGSGKSTWAAEHLPADTVVSSDRMRALVGAGEDDVTASAEALELVDTVVRRRVARGLTTCVDTTGLDGERRAGWLALAREHGMPCVAVALDTPAEECRARNRARDKRVPAAVLTAQLRLFARVREGLAAEGFDDVLTATPVRVVPAEFVGASSAAVRQRDEPVGLRVSLYLSRFDWPGGAPGLPDRLREIAVTADDLGLHGIYVMDHLRQIPQVGRAWEDLPESWTTLAYLAASTERVRLGTLVSPPTLRHVGHLAKVVATVDVLSAGRAVCGLGAGWFEAEYRALGIPFPPLAQRYAQLEDALRVLPLLWGPGSPSYEGRTVSVPEALAYPRPVQERVPLLVGGGGERTTLRLAATYADACNVRGDLATVRRKVAVLREHCATVGRPPEQVAVTHLSTVLVGADDADVAELVARSRPRGAGRAAWASSVNAGTVADHVGRFRELAEAGVQEVVVRLADLGDVGPVERLAEVAAAFRD